MARLVATASLAVLLFSLLAVTNCRVLETEPEELGTANPVVSQEADAGEVIPAGEGFLRLPSPQRHRHPCHHGQGLFHHHLWWARHHGLSHRHGDARADNLAVGPTELAVAHEEERRELEQEKEVQAVAEPDPDSHPDTDGEHEVEEETMKPFHGEEEEDDDDDKVMTVWKGEMLRRFRHHLRHQDDEEEEDAHEHGKEGAVATKRMFHFHHHQDGEEEMTSKRFHFHRDGDSKDEKEGEEEMARHWRKAMMRGRFRHGRRHHHRHHAEEAGKEGGVVNWFMDLMNHF